MGTPRHTKLKALLKGLLKTTLAVAILAFLGVFLLTGGRFFQKSGYANCVIVENEEDFSGEWLRYETCRSHAVRSTAECVEQDEAIDAGDGPRSGRVRWAECTHGPDCDEAGMY
jgi:hypothetical protein